MTDREAPPANFLTHLTFLFFRKIEIRKVHVQLGIVWSILAIFSFMLLFHCLDIMAAAGRARLVFPIGTGVCILGFSLYSLAAIREKYSRFTYTGIALVMVSLLLLALRD